MPVSTTTHAARAAAGPGAWYVTTAIPYVNAPPHIGFALEMVQADVLARFRRARGHAVRFQAGTDENSLKNVRAAAVAGVAVERLVAENAARFRALGPALDLSVDDFLRTSADARHRRGVERLWRACAERGDIYKAAYRGLYCVGCEQFYKPAELPDGRCPEHGTPPEAVAEENYFFRLSRYGDALHRAIASGRLGIVPAARRNEVLRWIEGGLEDFSISRSAARARGWGLPVPGDPDQVIYVWFDALGNYVTALGYGADGAEGADGTVGTYGTYGAPGPDGSDGPDGPAFARFWRDAAAREHVIGKGITRFHAVYWPAMLLSAGLPLPTRIYAHGYVTVAGAKIGKSAGNAVDPLPLAAERGADALRYYLLRHIRSTADGDFSADRFRLAYDAELAGQLGNLAHRTLSMIDRYCGGVIPPGGAGAALPEVSAPTAAAADPAALSAAAARLADTVAADIERFALHDALAAIWQVVALANKYVADAEPWSLAKRAGRAEGPDGGADAAGADDAADAAAARADLHHCLFALAAALRAVGRGLAPFLPATSARLLRQLGLDPLAPPTGDAHRLAGRKIRRDGLLFPPVDR